MANDPTTRKRPSQPSDPSIRQVLATFLDAQRRRLKPKTVSKYEHIVELLEHYLDGYAGEELDDADRRLLEQANPRGLGPPPGYCDLFGPERIPEHVGMFLDYFMVRKVMGGRDLMQAAGTVTRKLGRWLSDNGYLDQATSADMATRGGEAARDLPATRELMDLLDQCVDPLAADAAQTMEDHFQIDRVEQRRVHLSPMMSSEQVVVSLPQEVAAACRPGWTIAAIVGRVRGRWRLAEVWNVYP